MGKRNFGKPDGNVITVTSCSQGKGDVFHPVERTPKKRKRQIFGFKKRIFFPVPKPGLVGQADLFGLIQNEREKPEGKRDHESDPASREKRDRLKEPDERIPKLTGAG